ncbi:MAG: C1 family peptidase [Bacteroidales bacterium]|nr:C1 family peptidase [Bacteroidales bacterium]
MSKSGISIDPGLLNHDFSNKTEDMSEVMKQAIISNGIESVAFNSNARNKLQNNFSHEIKSGKITSQEKSGRCWMFAGLNLYRKKAAERLNMEDFEFSQNYPMFFDKLEKANYFLESVLRTLDEELDSRIVMWLMMDPLQDGGQWDMFVNLLKKYGAVPKSIMPETYHSSNSTIMNQLLTSKLRQWAGELRKKYSEGSGLSELRGMKNVFNAEFYRLLCYFLGNPPAGFDYEYRDKNEKQQVLTGLTPLEFFKDYTGVVPEDYISLIHSPTPDKPMGKTYTIDFLGNVVEGTPVLYLNTEIDQLKACTIRQLKDGEPVWFGCDIRIQTDRKKGIMDDRVFLYGHALDTTFPMDKAFRLQYGESLLTHAMVLTGVNLSQDKPNRWKVENSWGEERGEKGFFLMSDSWFDEYTYQVVVHKKYLGPDLQEQLKIPPVVLPPWDPMGSLAGN